MLQESVTRNNQISGLRVQEKKLLNKNPYMLQLKSFEDRLNNKSLKNKYATLMMRKPLDLKQTVCPKQVLNAAKQIASNGNCEIPYFNIDKENCFDAEVDIERSQQGNLLLRVRDKIYHTKNRRFFQEPRIGSSHTLDSVTSYCKSWLMSDFHITRGMKIRKFQNDVSFLKYKKNKNVYVTRLQ